MKYLVMSSFELKFCACVCNSFGMLQQNFVNIAIKHVAFFNITFSYLDS